MRLLVTGGCGFIGSNFIHYWLSKYPKDTLINLDKLTYAGHLSSLSDVTSPNYSFVHADICDANLVDNLMAEVEVVVHFAAESHVDRSLLDPQAFVKTNVLGTQVLLDAARKHNLRRFHHISTDEVFGSLTANSKTKFSETTPYAPRSPYSASKAAADHLVRAYFHSFNLPVTISNCSNNYGPFQDPEKFIPRSITHLLQNKPIQIYGDGGAVRDWLYVTDHCWAIDLIIRNSSLGKTYCIGGQKKLFTDLQIARQLLKLLGKPERMIEFVADRPGHDRRYAVDWSHINRQLHWSPVESLSSGLAKTVAWYEQHLDWWSDLIPQSESIYSHHHRNTYAS